MKRNLAVLLAGALCIALLLASAVLNYRERRRESAENMQMQLVPEPSAPGTGEEMPDGSVDLRGKPAPDFSLKTLDGKTVQLKDFRGRPVLINFWATWCAPCKIETPWLAAFATQYAPQGLQILGVTAENIPQDEVKSAAAKLGINYPVLLRGDTIAHDWGGLDGLPTSFFIARDGTIQDQTVGLYSRDELEAKLKKILAAPPAQAKS